MKNALAGLSLVVLTAGCVELGMAPEGTTPEILAAWDSAVASVGCSLISEKDYLPVELQTGLPREKVIEIAQYKVAREQAVSLENGGVESVVGVCAPVAEPAAEQVAQAG
ncbi:hypothetical protein [Sagittula sp. SSi028]|uniref:hypothetical protein n=1 Tax=Sagittula sp. SSi028 TaxID=3400636 RepID=UPI003AF86DD2